MFKLKYRYMEESGEDGGQEGGQGGQGEQGGQEGGGSDFLSVLPEDLRETLEKSGVRSVESLAKSFVDTKKMVGSSIRIPSEDAPPEKIKEFREKLSSVKGLVMLPQDDSEEERNRFMTAIGVPESADKYKLDMEKVPEGVEVPAEEMKAMLEGFRELGMTNQQAQKAFESYANRIAAEKEELRKLDAKLEADLKKELGAAYEEKMSAANFALNDLLPKDVAEGFRQTDLYRNPDMVKMMARVGELLKDDSGFKPARKATVVYTPEEAKERIDEIKAHPGYFDRKHPEHDMLVKKAEKLYKMAYGS